MGIWIPLSGNSQNLQTEFEDSTGKVTVLQDSTGFYFKVPFKRFQIASMKAKYFPSYLLCKEEVAGITKQYLQAQDALDSLNRVKDRLIINEAALALDNAKYQLKIDQLEFTNKKQKRSKRIWQLGAISLGSVLIYKLLQ